MRMRIGKWGNSLAVRIPGSVVKDLVLKEGMNLAVSIVDGAIILRPSRRTYTLEELVAGITPENRHEETDWGGTSRAINISNQSGARPLFP